MTMLPFRRRITGASGWLGFALGLAWASFATPGCSPQAGAERAPAPPTVSVVEARRKTVPILAEPIGTTRALQEVSVRARVRGFLKEMHFDEGGDVKAGQLLFVIDEEPFKAKLAEARARLDAAEANLKKAQDSKAREVATAQRTVAQATLDLAEVEERREQALLKRGASTIEDVQRKQALRKRDAAQMEADQASLEQSKADFETNILTAQADVEGAKAVVLDAEINLGYCRMSSPIDGRIGLAEVKLGNLVGPVSSGGGGDYTELAVVRQLDPMGIDIQVASRYLDRVAQLIGQGLTFEIFRPGIEGEQAHRFPGKATVIDNTINSTTSSFLMRGEIANPKKILLPGEYVKANAKVGEARDAVVVPEQAVVESQAGPTVYTVDPQGKVKIVPVRATFTHEGLRVLESGLEPGQPVIVEGLQLVRTGMTVKTRPAASAAPVDSTAPAPGQTSEKGSANAEPPTETEPGSEREPAQAPARSPDSKP
jgi:membrane fusion protein (multidrug efflux system)